MHPLFKFNILLSPADDRDYHYTQTNTDLADYVDLRKWDSLVEDQLKLGSCSGNAITNAYETLVKQYRPKEFVELSRLFSYYNARLIEGTTNTDSGASIRSAIQAVKTFGLCSESLWPYNIKMFNVMPPGFCYDDAKSRTIKNYYRLYSIGDMLDALSNNIPIVFGTTIYEQFLTIDKDSPIVQLPSESDKILGGHAMCIMGYDLQQQMFLAKNSFGSSWGDNGYCWIPFNYVVEFTLDAWIFELSELPIKSKNERLAHFSLMEFKPCILK